MKRTVIIFGLAIICAPMALTAQSFYSTSMSAAPEANADGGFGQTPSPMGRSVRGGSEGPFSHLALGAGISPLGIQLQATANVTGHFNLRAQGNIFNYNDNFTADGINANAKLNLQSAGVSVDLYPFRKGFRLSPGVLFMNHNQVTATTNVPAGTSFTLNDTTYYSANANAVTGATPVMGTGTLGLNTIKSAFTATIGWGNTARGNGHWSFPVDVGAAFTGAPSVKVNLTGWACYDEAQTQCSNLADPNNSISAEVQSNLTAQVAKWTSDLNPLKTFPILSFGAAYSFHVR